MNDNLRHPVSDTGRHPAPAGVAAHRGRSCWRYLALNDVASTMILRPRLSADDACAAGTRRTHAKADRMLTCKHAKIQRAGGSALR